MRATFLLLAFVVVAGCSERADPALPAGQAGTQAPPDGSTGDSAAINATNFPRHIGNFTAKLVLGACPNVGPDAAHCISPQMNAGSDSFGVNGTESQRAQREKKEWVITAEWTPVHPTAQTLGVRIGRGDLTLVAYAEGESPLEIRLPADALTPGTAYYYRVAPTRAVVLDQTVSFTLDLQ